MEENTVHCATLMDLFRKKGSFALAYMCAECHGVRKHNDIWFTARRQGRRKKTDTKIRSAFCNAMSNATGPELRRYDAFGVLG